MENLGSRGIPIIDSHLHVGRDWDGSEVEGNELIRLMDENNISKGLVFPLNERNLEKDYLSINVKILDLQKGHPQRIHCGFRLDPKTDFREILDFAEMNRIPVMKLHPTSQNFKLSSPCLRNLLEDLGIRKYRPIVYLHTDIIPVEGTHCEELNCPKDVIAIAKRYPEFQFVIAHCGRWCDATREGIIRVDNVYIDTSIAPLFLIRKCLSIVGADRVLFGSDYPYSHPRIELEKILLLNLPDHDTEAILSGNFSRLVC